LSSLAFGSVMSFFGIKGAFFAFFSNDKKDLRQIFFQDLRENACSLQPALKSSALGLYFGTFGLTWSLICFAEIKTENELTCLFSM